MILLINPGHDDSHLEANQVQSQLSSNARAVHRDPPPMSLLVYGTWLSEEGQSVRILDTHVESNWQDKLKSMLVWPLRWVGITVIIGKFQKNAAQITKLIRELDPHIPIVWGGVMCSVMPEEIKRTYKPDMVVSGGPPIDCISYPTRGLLGYGFNTEQVPYYNMLMTSTGCDHACSFCYKNAVSPRIRYRQASDVTDEMYYINGCNGSRVFAIGDDNFLTDPVRAKQILAYCKDHRYYLEEVIGHIGNLTDDLIEAMRGVVNIFIFSIETVPERLQDLLRKRIDLNAVPDKLSKLRDAGIKCNISFMVGLPTETEADLEDNWSYMQKLKRAHPVIRGNCYDWYPLPKTRLTSMAQGMTGHSFDFDIEDYEEATFWVKDENDVSGGKWRPHISGDKYAELVKWIFAFNKEFAYPEGTRVGITDDVLAGKQLNMGRAF